MPKNTPKTVVKQLSDLRGKMTELKNDITNPNFVIKLREIRDAVMAIYRKHSEAITKEDLILFHIIVQKEKA